MFDIIFNWIAKIRAERELLKLYHMVKKKKQDILYSCDTERFRRYYNETKLLENALAYILYTKFDCDNDRDVVWDYQFVSDVDIQEYIDNLLKSDKKDKRNYCIIGSLDEYINEATDEAIEAMSNSIYRWNGRCFIKYY